MMEILITLVAMLLIAMLFVLGDIVEAKRSPYAVFVLPPLALLKIMAYMGAVERCEQRRLIYQAATGQATPSLQPTTCLEEVEASNICRRGSPTLNPFL